MARIRTIKPDFWASESLGTRLTGPDGRQARLLFIALWNHAEDHGVCRAAPALLRSVAFPYDEDVSAADVSRWLGLLEAGRFIVRYEREGSSYLWVRAFAEHQKIDRPSKTTLPEPSNEERDMCASPRRVLVESSLPEGKGREGKGEEGSTPSGSAASAPLAPEAEELPDATDAAEEVPEDRPPLVLQAQKPEKPARKPSAGEALFARLEESRQKCCEAAEVPFVPSRWPHARMNRDLGPVARLETDSSKADEWGRFKVAWQAFIEDDEAERLDVPFSLDFFWRMRSRYEGRALKGES